MILQLTGVLPKLTSFLRFRAHNDSFICPRGPCGSSFCISEQRWFCVSLTAAPLILFCLRRQLLLKALSPSFFLTYPRPGHSSPWGISKETITPVTAALKPFVLTLTYRRLLFLQLPASYFILLEMILLNRLPLPIVFIFVAPQMQSLYFPHWCYWFHIIASFNKMFCDSGSRHVHWQRIAATWL